MTKTWLTQDSHRAAAWIAAGLVCLVLLVGCVSGESSSSAPSESAPENLPATSPPEPTLVPDSSPAAEPTATPAAAPAPAVAPTPTATPEPLPTLLLPGDGWKVAFMHTDVWPPSAPGPYSLSYAGTEMGVWGPVVEASFIPDVGYRDIGNRGTPYYDVETSSGAPVRVRTEFAPYSVTAVMAVDGGSVVVTSYELTEPELLLIVDGVSVNDRGFVDWGAEEWDEQALPVGLQPVESELAGVSLTQFNLQRGEDEYLSVMSVPVDHWQMPLLQRLMHADALSIEVARQPALVYEYDARSRDSAGAVYSDGERFYILDAGPGDPSRPQRTIEETTALLDRLEEIPVADIAAELGLRPRSEVIGAWIADIPLPDGVDLTWMLEGPPVDPVQEAFTAHQVFVCAWAAAWIESGDTAALDEIEASDNWPTSMVLAQAEQRSALSSSIEVSIDEARGLTSQQDLRTSALALNCSFLLGPAD